jgi:hypothetical protein
LAVDLTDWWTQTVNGYLTSVFSVGFFSALGGLVFYFVSRRLFPSCKNTAHIAATLTYGLGTLIFPFGTMLFDHNLIATLSLCAFGMLYIKKQGGLTSLRENLAYFFVGVLCGCAIVVNYTAILTGVCILVYGFWAAARRRPYMSAALAGFAVPILLLLGYHTACFGSPYATANTYQHAFFHSPDAALVGMLVRPNLTVAFDLLLSPYRGLFFTSPVLLFTALGLVTMVRRLSWRAEGWLSFSIFAAYLLLNSAFNHWHAGWTFGPRYLIPALPFLALPGALVFSRLPRSTGAVALVSMCMMLLITAVDPQVPSTTRNPLTDYVVRLVRGEWFDVNGITVKGPVSANPIGMYESWDNPAAAIGHAQRGWHSFNLGEFVFPGSVWSLAPLLLFLSTMLLSMRRILKSAGCTSHSPATGD